MQVHHGFDVEDFTAHAVNDGVCSCADNIAFAAGLTSSARGLGTFGNLTGWLSVFII
jgi:hypothetical protein